MSRWSLGSESGVGTRGRVVAKEPAPSAESGLHSYLCPEQGVLGPSLEARQAPLSPWWKPPLAPLQSVTSVLVTTARPHSTLEEGGEKTNLNPSSLAPGNCRHPCHCTPRKVWPGAFPGGWEIPSSVRSWEGRPPSSQTPLCAEGSAVLEAVRACGCEGRAETRAQEGGCPSRLPEQAAPWPAHQRDRAVGTSDPASGGRLQQPLSLFLGSSLCCPAPLFISHLEAVRPQGGAWEVGQK